MLFPIVGALLYIVIGGNLHKSKVLKVIKQSEENGSKYFVQDEKIKEEIENQNNGKINYNDINTLNGLKNLKNLKKLDLHWMTIKNLDCVAELTQLSSLTISDTNLIDISGISNLSNLTNVDFHNNAITDVENIGNLSILSSLTLNNNYISTGLQVFSNLHNLESIE